MPNAIWRKLTGGTTPARIYNQINKKQMNLVEAKKDAAAISSKMSRKVYVIQDGTNFITNLAPLPGKVASFQNGLEEPQTQKTMSKVEKKAAAKPAATPAKKTATPVAPKKEAPAPKKEAAPKEKPAPKAPAPREKKPSLQEREANGTAKRFMLVMTTKEEVKQFEALRKIADEKEISVNDLIKSKILK